ncbi:VOC family protein [Clostridium estertheticum]|uniref:VOC family protein n=1 Tax=Clostridium estertheticum TaxID=238834 RepID=UPI001C7CC86D|nr:VOC family protein [Clostridium estertheticum]MBX4271322.1 VOC family protein [Clostridium estertheticum]WLC78264.1 VOC family protein [Clostridium estertheticum]
MQKIVPHLWYDKEANEAAIFYISLFDKSKILNVTIMEGTPLGDAESINFELAGQQFAV